MKDKLVKNIFISSSWQLYIEDFSEKKFIPGMVPDPVRGKKCEGYFWLGEGCYWLWGLELPNILKFKSLAQLSDPECQ